MRQAFLTIRVSTSGPGLYDVTDKVMAFVQTEKIADGLLTCYIRHTSASLLIQENAAREVRSDLETFFARIAPEDASAYAHDDEGPDDMPAHIRTALTQVHLCIPLIGSRLALGTWQGIYLFEHRRRPHTRTLVLHLLGE